MSENFRDWLTQWLWNWSQSIEVRLQTVERQRDEARREHRAIARRLRWIERGAQALAVAAITALLGYAPQSAEMIGSLIYALLQR